MIDKQYVINNVSNIEKVPNVTILKMLMEFKKQLEESGAFHSIRIGEVVTLEAEEPAYITNVGTTTDLILNVGIPRGVGFNYSGEWVSDDNEYHPNDVVLYNGSLYICVSTILDSEVAPPIDVTHWSLFLGFGDVIGNFINNLYNNRDNIIYKENIQNSKLELVWSGAIYEIAATVTIPNYSSDNLYLIEFYGFSGTWKTYQILSPTNAGQYIIQGDSSQFCRYRLENNDGILRISTNGTTGNTSNTAITGIYKVKGGNA